MRTRNRRKALVIIGFDFLESDKSLRIKQSNYPPAPASIHQEFLIARDKQTKRPGVVEVEIVSAESVQSALHRFNFWSDVAIVQPWEEIGSFSHTENTNTWIVLVGIVGRHPHQQGMALIEQSNALPFSLEGQNPDRLFRQNQGSFLDLITSQALEQPAVREFLSASRRAA